jgi:hypothetical protein
MAQPLLQPACTEQSYVANTFSGSAMWNGPQGLRCTEWRSAVFTPRRVMKFLDSFAGQFSRPFPASATRGNTWNHWNRDSNWTQVGILEVGGR